MQLNNESKGVLAMLILSLIYGVAGYTARLLQVHLGTWQQLALQSWLAFALLVVIHAAAPSGPKFQLPRKKDLKSLFGRAVFGRILSSYFFIQACLLAPLGNVGWICALPTSALFGWLLFGQQVSRREWVLLAIGMIGVGIIVSPGVDLASMPGRGELYALVSTLASGLGALFGRSIMRERGSVYTTGWVLLFTSLLASSAAYAFEDGLKLPPADVFPVLGAVSVMVALGAACSLIGYTYLYASTATALLSLEAVWALVIGLLVYGEQPSINSLAGGGIIVLVACFIAPARKRDAARSTHPKRYAPARPCQVPQ